MSGPPPKPDAHWYTWILGAGAIAMLLYFARPPILGGLYTEDDLGAFHLPLRWFYRQCLVNGDNPFWMPHLFNGFYLLGEGQVGMLHPWHWLTYRFLPLETAFNLEVVSSFPILFAGVYVFMRRWNIHAAGALTAATLAALIGFPMNHYIHLHFASTLCHVPWALLAIDHILRAPTNRASLKWQIALLLLNASQVLLAMPQAVIFAWMIEGAYAVALLLESRRVSPFLALGLLKVFAVGIGAVQIMPMLEAAQESWRAEPDAAFRLSISLHPLNYLQLFNPYLFDQRVYRPIQGDEPWDAPYLGAAAPVLLLLACWAVRRQLPFSAHQVEADSDRRLVDEGNGDIGQNAVTLNNAAESPSPRPLAAPFQGGGRRSRTGDVLPSALLDPLNRPPVHRGPIPRPPMADTPFEGGPKTANAQGTSCTLTVFALALIAFGAVAALGRYGPLDTILQFIPGLNVLRAPARYMALAHFGLALAAGVGIARLVESRRDPHGKPFLLPFVIVLAGSMAALVVRFAPSLVGVPETAFGSKVAVMLGALLVIVATALVSIALRGARWALPALAIVALVDIGLYSLRHKPVQSLDDYRTQVALPPAPPGARIDPDIHPSFMNRYAIAGYRQPFGYAALQPKQALDFTDPDALRVAGVTWRKVRAAAPETLTMERVEEDWAPLDGAWPRAWIVDSVSLYGALPETHRPEHVSVIRDEPGEVAVRLSANAAGVLVVSERHNRHWTVTGGDGQVREDGTGFLAVNIDAGDDREVVFRFPGLPGQPGFGLSMGALAIAFAYFSAVKLTPRL